MVPLAWAPLNRTGVHQQKHNHLILDYAFALKFGSWQNCCGGFLFLSEKTANV